MGGRGGSHSIWEGEEGVIVYGRERRQSASGRERRES